MSVSIYKSSEGEREVMALYDAALGRWPVPYNTLRTPTRHGETFAVASGNPADLPLVLLHGACSNALSWTGDVTIYSRHFRVYAVDLPGEPGRSAANRPDWNGPAFAEWMEDFLTFNRIIKPSLVGISQGGWTALKYAVTRPENVEKLVLLAPGGVTHDKLSFLLPAVFYSFMGKWGADRINRLTFGKDEVHPEAVKFMTAIMKYFRARIGKLTPYSNTELARLNMPVLLLGGKLDPLRDPDKIAARLNKFLPDLTVKIYLDKGHVLVNTAAEILPFLLNHKPVDI
jgi:pimeloyl-ACP methyl ester carboxylesterase